jgi:hypothetical protein
MLTLQFHKFILCKLAKSLKRLLALRARCIAQHYTLRH